MGYEINEKKLLEIKSLCVDDIESNVEVEILKK